MGVEGTHNVFLEYPQVERDFFFALQMNQRGRKKGKDRKGEVVFITGDSRNLKEVPISGTTGEEGESSCLIHTSSLKKVK